VRLSGDRKPANASTELELELSDGAPVAGAVLRGLVSGTSDPVTVTLLRLEHSPVGTFSFAVTTGSTRAEGDRTSFEMSVPGDIPPSWDTGPCQLGHAVQARSFPPRRRARRQAARQVEIAGGEQRIHRAGADHLDRMIPMHPARHFHVELTDALLEGGGRIDGRLHTQAACERGLFGVVVQCHESWRTNLRFRNWRAPPLWRGRSVWRADAAVEVVPGRNWYPFGFAIPVGLPPAFEGLSIAWRYQIEVRRKARLPVSDHAVVTPLRFDACIAAGTPG
jgi:hypothetical protein